MSEAATYICVSDGNGRLGFTVDQRMPEMVTLHPVAEPGAIVRRKSTNSKQRDVAWEPQDEYQLAEAIRVPLEGDERGLLGSIDVNTWTGDQLERVTSVPTSDGVKHVVPIAHQSDLVTHYAFDDIEQERGWIADRITKGRSVAQCSGGPVRLSQSTRELLGTHVGATPLSEVAREQLRTEIEALHRDHAAVRTRLADVQMALKSVESERGSLQTTLEQSRADHERFAGEVVKAQERIEDLERQRRDVDGWLRERRAELEASLTELKQARTNLVHEQADLSMRVEHLRTQLDSGVPADDSAIRERARLLGELPEVTGETDAVGQLIAALADRADVATVVGLHVALKQCPFVVLTGPSGSGKSSLLTRYARALGMASEVVAVQPNWTSSADLHGYVAPIGAHRHFVTTPFADVLGLQFPDGEAGQGFEPPFVSLAILDEINLAHVEYYLADYLSALEADERVVTIASQLEIAGAQVPLWLRRLRGRVPLPQTFLMAGTANEDHTTRGFSDKFRDRAAVLEIPSRPSKVGAAGGLVSAPVVPIGRVPHGTWQTWRDHVPSASARLHDTMKSAEAVLELLRSEGFHVGHRIVRDVEVVMRAAQPLLRAHLAGANEQASANVALDLALAMRVVQKYVPLVFRRTSWSLEERRAFLEKLEAKVPKACTRTRQQLAAARQ